MQYRRYTPFAAACGLLAAFVAGCSQNNPPATPPTATVVNNPPPAATTTTVTTATPAPGTPDTKINTNAGPGTSNGTDTATADAVNTAIVHNKQMTGSRVDVVVTDGVARLTGPVQNQQQKALAGVTASKTPGVNSVINKLQIVATGGAKEKPAVTEKVINHTTVVNHYIPVPTATGNSGGTSGSGTDANGGGSGTGDTGASSGASGDNGGTGDNSSTPPSAPPASGSNP